MPDIPTAPPANPNTPPDPKPSNPPTTEPTATRTVGRTMYDALADDVLPLLLKPRSGTGVRTISARWRNVMINHTVGVHFQWQ